MAVDFFLGIDGGQRVYKGWRDPNDRFNTRITVEREWHRLGAPGTGKRRLTHRVKHSPTGMGWGYAGSGPADLARSILWDACGPDLADLLYQDFKGHVIQHLPDDSWELRSRDIYAWLAANLATKLERERASRQVALAAGERGSHE